MVTFELLCVSSSGSCVIRTDAAICYSLMANTELLGTASLANQNSLRDADRKLTIQVSHVESGTDEDAPGLAFLVRAKAPFAVMEPFRVKLVQHLKNNKFDHIYVLQDDVSSQIAHDLYPGINRVENALRKYVLKFFVTKLGANWWNVTADTEMQKKVTQRKNNETVFSPLADGKAYLIDFGELGRIVYAQSSGFISRDDIYTRVMALEDTAEAVLELKSELQSNYNKFFRETFKDKNFQQKWEELEKIRHKVAHNGLFVAEDQERGKALCTELHEIISTANTSIDQVTFSISERDAITDSIVTNSAAYKVITRKELIQHLQESERWALAREGFLSLNSFIRHYLGQLDYHYSSTYDMVTKLEQEGVVEIYEHQGAGHNRPVKAIRLKSGLIQPNRPLASIGEVLADGRDG